MKKETKKRKVLKLLSEGMKPKDIAAKMKIKTQQVYVIKSEAKKKREENFIKFINENVNNGTVSIKTEPVSLLRMKEEKSFFQKIKDFFGA